MSEPLTKESFEEWQHHPITNRLFKLLKNDRETMKEGLINNTYLDESNVKGRCRAIEIILSLEYTDLFTD
jgi:uncharacterized phage-associated protein